MLSLRTLEHDGWGKKQREWSEAYVKYGRGVESNAQGSADYAQNRIDQWREEHWARSLFHEWLGIGGRELVEREAALQTARQNLEAATLDREEREAEVDAIKASVAYQDRQDLAVAAQIELSRRWEESITQRARERELERERDRSLGRGDDLELGR